MTHCTGSQRLVVAKCQTKVAQRKLQNQKTNLQQEYVDRSSLKWMYDSAKGLNKGLKYNMWR